MHTHISCMLYAYVYLWEHTQHTHRHTHMTHNTHVDTPPTHYIHTHHKHTHTTHTTDLHTTYIHTHTHTTYIYTTHIHTTHTTDIPHIHTHIRHHTHTPQTYTLQPHACVSEGGVPVSAASWWCCPTALKPSAATVVGMVLENVRQRGT